MARATTFTGVIALLRKAEDALIRKANQTDPNRRVSTLRGIYYGTDWSLIERKRSEAVARIRSAGFRAHAGGDPPVDPRPALGQALFDDLQQSQTIHDGGHGIDIGRMLIGLETRGSASLRTKIFPGQGGTGLEIVTWLGDLGSGAANLARKRVTAPATSVRVIFNNTTSDHGVMDNLEGDIAAYMVACGSTSGGATRFGRGGSIADALAAYAPTAKGKAPWLGRSAGFTAAIGGKVKNGVLTNPSDLVGSLSDKLYEFAVWYAATRWIPSGELQGPAAIKLCEHARGAAREVATVFVQTLVKSMQAPSSAVAATAPYPAPSKPSPCESALLKGASTNPSKVNEMLEEWGRQIDRLFD